MKILVGNTGTVGKTLLDSIEFDFEFNSKNINDFHKVPDGCELYLACLPAAKWLVNKDPSADATNIENLVKILSTKSYKKIILFSTIDVYCESPQKVDESFMPIVKTMNYGTNRYLFEVLVKSFLRTESLKIFRLPAVYGKHIKKNIIYDLIHNNNVDKINLNSSYQWYNLSRLHQDVQDCCEYLKYETVINLFPEPVHTKNIVKLFPKYNLSYYGDEIVYDFRAKHCRKQRYIQTKKYVLDDIKEFVNAMRK